MLKVHPRKAWSLRGVSRKSFDYDEYGRTLVFDITPLDKLVKSLNLPDHLNEEYLLDQVMADLLFDWGIFNVVRTLREPTMDELRQEADYYPFHRLLKELIASEGNAWRTFDQFRKTCPELIAEQCDVRLAGSSLFLLFY
ncbi:hypothetical protein ACLPJK_26120 [Pseudomonas aeruginosa]|uniref:hypothetical protein n=1 Tax=Pseudomonas aeruginosa TaxID=287 RepID=UPI003D2BF530